MSDRIVSNPAVLGGKPCVGGTRLSVEFLLELVGSGGSPDQIAAAYPQVSADDVRAAVMFAARALRHERLVEVGVPS